MKLLTTIRSQDFTPDLDTTGIDISSFHTRQAARAVLLGEAGQVYLLHASAHGYHKLPGGGLNEDEPVETALAREIMEEIGCEAEILDEVGEIIEHRYEQQLVQTSYCYLAQQTGALQPIALEKDEIAEGLEVAQASNIDDAIALLRADKPDSIGREFMRKRDLTFLEAARDIARRVAQP
jgi:ADP-ribose pyrophosphatase YjhB (NUDIX family)